MTLQADLFFSFRSPYSYIGAARYRALGETRDVDIAVRPVYPIAIRDPGFFKDANPLWVPYLLRDIVRVAQFHGLPIALPDPDPVVMNMATREIAAEQPYIRPITRLGVAAARRGAGLAFIDEVSRALWGEGVKNWHLPENLAPIVARAGLDLAELQADIDGREDEFESEIAANHAALEAAGHWGVPTLVFQGEPFFGQDRIDLAIWRMEQNGLGPRA